MRKPDEDIFVKFDDGMKLVASRWIDRWFEGQYHYVREPKPMVGYEFLQDTYGHWTAVERNER